MAARWCLFYYRHNFVIFFRLALDFSRKPIPAAPRPGRSHPLVALGIFHHLFTMQNLETLMRNAYYRSRYGLRTPTHRARAARPRAKNTFLQILYSTLWRTSHHSGGPRNFDKLVIRCTWGAFPCVCMLLQNSQNTKPARSV
jgi:hypothetical protein